MVFIPESPGKCSLLHLAAVVRLSRQTAGRSGGRAHRGLGLLVFAVAALTPAILSARQSDIPARNAAAPDAPQNSASANGPGSEQAAEGSGSILGTVLSPDGSEIKGARVVLSKSDGTDKRVEQSGDNGAFNFTGLPAGTFELAVSGPGWGRFVSPSIQLGAGEFRIVPHIVLPVATSTSITVVGNPAALAEEQVHIAEQQRVLGVFPNFYSSYDWNAPPMGAEQKFQLALRSAVDPTAFLGAGVVAGIEQKANVFPAYGPGAEGYSKRYASAYANSFTGRMLSNAVFPAVFHQDPRYFYRGTGSFGSRAAYAIEAAVMARGDNGRWEPNYAHICGSFAAGAMSNLYYPAENRGAMLTVMNGLVGIADEAAMNLVREFVLKGFTTRAKEAQTQVEEP